MIRCARMLFHFIVIVGFLNNFVWSVVRLARLLFDFLIVVHPLDNFVSFQVRRFGRVCSLIVSLLFVSWARSSQVKCGQMVALAL